MFTSTKMWYCSCLFLPWFLFSHVLSCKLHACRLYYSYPLHDGIYLITLNISSSPPLFSEPQPAVKEKASAPATVVSNNTAWNPCGRILKHAIFGLSQCIYLQISQLFKCVFGTIHLQFWLLQVYKPWWLRFNACNFSIYRSNNTKLDHD